MGKCLLDQSFSFDGQHVAWTRMGQGNAVILVHGTPFSAQVWRRIAPLLARRRTVYLFDLLGYGASEMRAGQDVSLAVQNRLLAALIDHWDIEAPHVVAHDFGGATALRAHYLNGCRYRRLTLIDPVALRPWGSPFVAHVRDHEAAFAGLPAYAHEALLAAYLQGAAYRPLSQEALETYAAPWRGASGQAAFYRQIAQMDQAYTDEIEGFYGAMDCPVEVMWGEQDSWIPIATGEALAQRFGVRLDRVPEAGHLVQEDAPEAIVAAILDA